MGGTYTFRIYNTFFSYTIQRIITVNFTILYNKLLGSILLVPIFGRLDSYAYLKVVIKVLTYIALLICTY